TNVRESSSFWNLRDKRFRREHQTRNRRCVLHGRAALQTWQYLTTLGESIDERKSPRVRSYDQLWLSYRSRGIERLMYRRFIRLSVSFVVRNFDYWTLPSLVKGFVMEETFRLDLNKSWEAIDIKTGHAVVIPKGSHLAIRMLLKSPPDQTEENYLV